MISGQFTYVFRLTMGGSGASLSAVFWSFNLIFQRFVEFVEIVGKIPRTDFMEMRRWYFNLIGSLLALFRVLVCYVC
jgi:hypothetical protein